MSLKRRSKKITRRAFRYIFRNGLWASILMSVLILLFHLVGIQISRPVHPVAYFILLAFMFITSYQYKMKGLRGWISFKQAYLSGLLTGLFSAVLFGLFMWAFVRWIDPAVSNKYYLLRENAIKLHLSGDRLAAELEAWKIYVKPVFIGLRAILELALVSLFIPLLFSIVLKKEKPE